MKTYTIIAGINGAGKTTLYETYEKLQSKNLVNADVIRKELGLSIDDPSSYVIADKEAVRRLYSYIEDGVSFVQENVLCSGSILTSINTAREKGFKIVLHYVGLESADIAKERVAERIALGGIGPSGAEIERRYYWSLVGLSEVLPLTDLAALYDNTNGLTRFAIYKKGKPSLASDIVPNWYSSLFKAMH